MTRRLQRGLGTLAMCVVLLGVLALGAAWATRQLTTAERVAANDHRAATAFEAAEAGMAWAIAMLNGGHVDDSCRPASHPAGPSADIAATGDSSASATDFRSRFLQLGADGHYRAKPIAPATGGAMSPACTNTGPLRWTCQCATQGDPSSASPTADSRPADPQPRFTVRFTDAGPAGQLKLIVRGCSDRRADCDDLSEGPSGLAEAARHLALLSALRLPPPQA
ncbi:PilX N-terminal domain-containing pilus assembly protein, partial [Mitsuaria sp. TWR114]|uniref:PilX N-terminal domain-containing pilus assembly protein n=2 Tax=Roseateles TaxID=93681 RepID=UPI002102C146